MNGDAIAKLRRHRPELPPSLVVTACMGTHRDASASVYRSMPLRAPEAPSRDELVEVTPTAIRIRKRILDHNERRRFEKGGES